MSVLVGVRSAIRPLVGTMLVVTSSICVAQNNVTPAKKPLPAAKVAAPAPAKPAPLATAAQPIAPATAQQAGRVSNALPGSASGLGASTGVQTRAGFAAPPTQGRQGQSASAQPAVLSTAPGGSSVAAAPSVGAGGLLVPTNSTTVSPGLMTAPGVAATRQNSSLGSWLSSGSTSGSNPGGGSDLGTVANSQTGSRSANFAAGLGTFHGLGFTLTAFGCFRSNTRVFCDFDLSDTQSRQVGMNIFGTVGLILDGGRIVARHNAFFLGQDGTQFTVAATSPGNPVRYVMEYDDVSANFAAVTLANGGDRISNVGVAAMDGSQAPGTVPARGAPAATPPAGGVASSAATAGTAVPNASDKVSSTISNATATKQKVGGWLQQLQQLKPASQTH